VVGKTGAVPLEVLPVRELEVVLEAVAGPTGEVPELMEMVGAVPMLRGTLELPPKGPYVPYGNGGA